MDASHYSTNVTGTTAPSYPSPVAVSPQQLQHHQHSVQTLPPLQPQNPVMHSMYGSHPQTPRTPATPNTPGSASTVGGYPQQQQAQAGRGAPYQMMPVSQYAPAHGIYAPTSSAMMPQASVAVSHPQPIAPAPGPVSRPPVLRPNPMQPSPLTPNGSMSPYGAQPGMMPGQQGGMPPEGDQPTHVVGSQGRRGVLPSAPGRPPVPPAGSVGKLGTLVPVKDQDGKFPCPHCPKTYLHAKHLKRHMLRHTGDRPYMCVLCRDTFSRSDILKRHFQKCSIRRGNPTGASHLSHPGAHVKKSQATKSEGEPGGDMNHMNGMNSNNGINNMSGESAYPQYGVMPDSMNSLSNDSRSPSITKLEDTSGDRRVMGAQVMSNTPRGTSFEQTYAPALSGPMSGGMESQYMAPSWGNMQ